MKIKFCGAATGVTGSCHLISTENHKVLFDCGQFQGGSEEESLNRMDFPFNPAEIDAVIVSHAHIDHCGRLPLLVKQGFKGQIFATDPTADLLDVMLKDSAHIHEQEAEQKTRKNQRAGKGAVEPLYTTNDALDTLKFVRPVAYDTLVEVNEEMKICFNDAGHILGSAIIELWVSENENTKKIVFSGDLGMVGRPILKDPITIKKADYVIMETTYGNRVHEKNATSVGRLTDIIEKVTLNGGNVVIPSFAVGRTQELIFELNKVYDGNSELSKKLKNVPVYVDSPMSVMATEVFRKNAQAYDDEMKSYLLDGDHPLDFKNLHYSSTSDESKQINIDQTPKVIISASGMCDAGRIRHHLKHNLWDSKNAIVFVGYQAEGTLGKLLLSGAKTVKLFGEEIAVNAQIYNLEGFSGHADRDALFAWLSGFKAKPKEIFLVHGEMDAKRDFADYVKANKDWDCEVVDGFNEYSLDEKTVLTQKTASAETEFAERNTKEDLLKKLAEASEELESIIKNAAINLEDETTEQQIVEIKNTLSALQRDIINLGASTSK
ncbi:MAG: MBL fold metallo-hydrolase [Clostridia bacterium]|nr:MBL fold metallo-hydrolase [Clostridia bacterium]